MVDAASASRQNVASDPPLKVYRNKDVKQPGEANNTSQGAAAPSSVPNTAPESTSAQKSSAQAPSTPVQSPAAFKARGDIYRNQILLEKEKIADIQNRMTDLKYQFDEWSSSLAQDPTDASICWTSGYTTPYYKDWCDTGRKLKAQYDAVQGQLEAEKGNLEKMQEEIRRKGYGNAVYDPDWP